MDVLIKVHLIDDENIVNRDKSIILYRTQAIELLEDGVITKANEYPGMRYYMSEKILYSWDRSDLSINMFLSIS